MEKIPFIACRAVAAHVVRTRCNG